MGTETKQVKSVTGVSRDCRAQTAGRMVWRCGRYNLPLSERTHIMGILNVTPDSFSDGGLFLSKPAAVEHALRMEAEGADIIDIGAESTRPAAKPVSARGQLRRIGEIVKILVKKLKIPVSIDTSNAVVAARCLDTGASIINDVTALRRGPELGRLIAEYNAGVVLMHMRGNPGTMQKKPVYKDVIEDIFSFLHKARQRARRCGIKAAGIVLDPGIGFGKTAAHNLQILRGLPRFTALGCPLLIGTSRKSFIGQVLGVSVTEREYGTAASVAIAVLNGAHVVRVHNVRRMKQAAMLGDAVKRGRV